MENKISKIIILEDGKKYVIVKQAIYKNETYFILNGLAEDEITLLDEVKMVKEIKEENDLFIEEVEDTNIFNLVAKSVGLFDQKLYDEGIAK